jgi:hypothetical protein
LARSAPRLGEALAVLDAVDVFETPFECPPEVGTVSLRSPPLACKRPVPTLESGYGRTCSGLASGSRLAVHVQPTGAHPNLNHLVVREVEDSE